MDNRLYKSAAVAGAPTAPASPSVGYPVDGDPVGGITATKAGAYWFHQVGEELRAAIVAGGLTPAAGTLNQLATAIFGAKSLTANGYQKLPGGLIIQWGSVVVGSTTDQVAVSGTFPIAFPNACFVVTGTCDGAGDFLAGNTFTASGFSGIVYDRLSLSNPVAGNLKYLAIGY